MTLICILLSLYLLVLLAAVVLSWIQVMRPLPYSGPARRVIDVIYALTNPVFGLVRGILPMVRLGGMGLDLSPIIVFIVIGILRAALC